MTYWQAKFVRFTVTEFVRVHVGVVCSLRNSVKLYVCMYKKNCIRNWALPIGALRDQYKQTVINTPINITRLRISTGGRQTSWLFSSVAEKLNSGLPRTTSASGQNGIWTRDLRISNTRPRCLHVAWEAVMTSRVCVYDDSYIHLQMDLSAVCLWFDLI